MNAQRHDLDLRGNSIMCAQVHVWEVSACIFNVAFYLNESNRGCAAGKMCVCICFSLRLCVQKCHTLDWIHIYLVTYQMCVSIGCKYLASSHSLFFMLHSLSLLSLYLWFKSAVITLICLPHISMSTLILSVVHPVLQHNHTLHTLSLLLDLSLKYLIMIF